MKWSDGVKKYQSNLGCIGDPFCELSLEEEMRSFAQIDSRMNLHLLVESEGYEVNFDASFLRADVDKIIKSIKSSKLQKVLRLRFGFDGNSYTLAEIGGQLGLTPARIRQMEHKALRLLRQRSRRFLAESAYYGFVTPEIEPKSAETPCAWTSEPCKPVDDEFEPIDLNKKTIFDSAYKAYLDAVTNARTLVYGIKVGSKTNDDPAMMAVKARYAYNKFEKSAEHFLLQAELCINHCGFYPVKLNQEKINSLSDNVDHIKSLVKKLSDTVESICEFSK